MIPVGTVTTSTVEGGRLVSVICEKCGTNFFYQLNRQASGKGSAVMFVGQQAAHERSQGAAHADLRKRLTTEVELVPCPECHWVNEEAIRQYRKQMYRRAPKLILVIVIGGFVGSILLMGFLMESGQHRLTAIIPALLMLVSLTSPIWVLVARHILRRRLDPNRLYPHRAIVPPGTPPALLKTKSPDGRREILRPA